LAAGHHAVDIKAHGKAVGGFLAGRRVGHEGARGPQHKAPVAGVHRAQHRFEGEGLAGEHVGVVADDALEPGGRQPF